MKNDREKSKKKTFLILDCVFEFFTLNFELTLASTLPRTNYLNNAHTEKGVESTNSGALGEMWQTGSVRPDRPKLY